MRSEQPVRIREKAADSVELPSPTAWPIVLAAGITLVFAGMLTMWS